jgi:hypothetical protein
MVPQASLVIFSLDDLQYCAEGILRASADSIAAYRLGREVLRLPASDAGLRQLKSAVLKSHGVRKLEESQLPDGSWGRFHSQDTKTKTLFRTSEEAIDRAFALGLEPNDSVLVRARQYILAALEGRTKITDPPEKNERWSLLVQLILAGRLAQLDPTNPALDSFWTYWVEVARQAFTSGNYRLEDEAAAYPRLSGIHAPQGYLESQHALWILSSRKLPTQLDRALVHWIWNKPDGIRYLRVRIPDPPLRLIGYWLRSMNILSRFASWREFTVDVLNNLWKQRDEDGLWDYGGNIAKTIDFPLSETWRQAGSRKMDYSTCNLALLRKTFD